MLEVIFDLDDGSDRLKRIGVFLLQGQSSNIEKGHRKQKCSYAANKSIIILNLINNKTNQLRSAILNQLLNQKY
jgi:hypothetical protein